MKIIEKVKRKLRYKRKDLHFAKNWRELPVAASSARKVGEKRKEKS